MEDMEDMKAFVKMNSSGASTEASVDVMEASWKKWNVLWKLLSWKKVSIKVRVRLPPWKLPW